jgi:hypothetical protein
MPGNGSAAAEPQILPATLAACPPYLASRWGILGVFPLALAYYRQ